MERDGRKYTMTYRLEGSLPLVVTREDELGKKDYFILRPATEEDAPMVYKSVQESTSFLKRYAPSVVERYGTSLARTQEELKHSSRSVFPAQEHVAIFYKSSLESEEQLLGEISIHSYSAYEKGCVGMAYWRIGQLTPATRGMFKVVCKIFLFHIFLHYERIDQVEITFEEGNEASMRVAKFLGAAQATHPHRRWWPYAELQGKMKTQTLKAEEFLERELPPRLVRRRQGSRRA